MADLRSAISRRPSSILASRALRRKAQILGYCDMRAVGGRAGLRRKKAHFLDQPGTEKIAKSQKWPYQFLIGLRRLSPFGTACLSKSKVNKKIAKRQKWPYQFLIGEGRLSPFVIACLSKSKVNKKNGKKPKTALWTSEWLSPGYHQNWPTCAPPYLGDPRASWPAEPCAGKPRSWATAT